MNTCEYCGGEGGFVEVIRGWRYDEDYERQVDCPACGGSGWVYVDPEQLDMDEAFEPLECP